MFLIPYTSENIPGFLCLTYFILVCILVVPKWVFKGFPGGSAGKEFACNPGDLGLIPGLGRSPEEGNGWLPTPVFWPGEFHGQYSPWGRKESDTTSQLSHTHPDESSGASQVAQVVKNLPANAGDTGLIPRLGRFPGEESGSPIQYSCLGNPVDRGAWRTAVPGVTKSQTWLSMHAGRWVLYQEKSGIALGGGTPLNAPTSIFEKGTAKGDGSWDPVGSLGTLWCQELEPESLSPSVHLGIPTCYPGTLGLWICKECAHTLAPRRDSRRSAQGCRTHSWPRRTGLGGGAGVCLHSATGLGRVVLWGLEPGLDFSGPQFLHQCTRDD